MPRTKSRRLSMMPTSPHRTSTERSKICRKPPMTSSAMNRSRRSSLPERKIFVISLPTRSSGLQRLYTHRASSSPLFLTPPALYLLPRPSSKLTSRPSKPAYSFPASKPPSPRAKLRTPSRKLKTPGTSSTLETMQRPSKSLPRHPMT